MIHKDNFVMIAMKAYDNPSCKTIVEFEEDLAKFSNLVRLASKKMNPIEIHLLLNNVVLLLNVFSQYECIVMMFFKVKQKDWSKLKTILVFLNRMPSEIPELGIKDGNIEISHEMLEVLKKI